MTDGTQLRLFVSKGFGERFEFGQQRLEIFLIPAPAAHRAFENWFGHVGIGGRPHQLFPDALVKASSWFNYVAVNSFFASAPGVRLLPLRTVKRILSR